ncbi:hypothetical protein [Herbiconiux liangxiaofengii]|uniref:hypothetical protein n=1 Tax=Herbiconiux liangxiaofengii TaxID=3342795 RepID=UPI0035B8241D
MHHPPSAVPAPSRVVTGAIGAAAVLALTAGSLLLADSARAAFVDVPTATGMPGRLVLAADPYPAMFPDLSPGDPAYWRVDARLEDAARATLSLELRKDGELAEHPRGLVMTVDRCSVAWTGVEAGAPTCAEGAARITQATPEDDHSTTSPSFELTPLVPGSPEHLLVTLAVEDSAAAQADSSLMGLTGGMGVGLTATAVDGAAITPVKPSKGNLANTGREGMLSGVIAFGALTAGLIGLALVIARTRLRRQSLSGLNTDTGRAEPGRTPTGRIHHEEI